MDRFVLDMIRDKIETIRSGQMIPQQNSNNDSWREINDSAFNNFQEIGSEIVHPREFDELRDIASEHDDWSEFIKEGKKKLRQIGFLVILLGTYFLLSFVSYFIFGGSVISISFMICVLLFAFLFSTCTEYHAKIK